MPEGRIQQEVGWRAFSVWSLCGALWAVPWFTFGPGVVTLPFAGLLTWALGRHAPNLRDAWGLPFGIGGLTALVSLANLDSMRTGLVGGVIVSAVAFAAYLLSGRHRSRSRNQSN